MQNNISRLNKRKVLKTNLKKYWQLYLLLLIPIVITIVYKYIPIYGLQIAFKDYRPGLTFAESEFVGMEWFDRFFSSPNANRMIRNTVLLNVYNLFWSFPIPIFLALIVNQVKNQRYKRSFQTVVYAPHFISVMLIAGMVKIFLSPNGGLINLLLDTNIDFLTEADAFRSIYIISGIWQDMGWNSILYVSTLASVNTELYEAAKIDGATMWQRIRYIDWPTIRPVTIIHLILAVGGIMNLGFEKVYLLQTDLNKATSDVISVFVYEQGLIRQNYSYATAIELFNTVINISLVFIVSRVAKKYSDISFI